jgi:phytoene dehydrogenase-like protein
MTRPHQHEATTTTSLRPSAIVVGSGPNGLAAAIMLARAGLHVTVLEAEDTIGGGMRSAPLTLPGFIHDVCSAIHPMAAASPFFRSLHLEQYGLEWIHAPAPLAHPLDDGSAAVLVRSVDDTATSFGQDAAAYRRMFAPLVARSDELLDVLLGPLLPPKHIALLAHFGLAAIRSARSLARGRFHGPQAQALFAGVAAHSMLPLTAPASASFALALGMVGHAWGWPFARGGTQAIATALAEHLGTLGGSIITGRRVESYRELSGADIVMFGVTPRQLVAIAGEKLPHRYRRRLMKYRYAPAAFKLDWALSAPIPWRARACATAAAIHLGGTLDEISESEHLVNAGRHPDRPFIILAQQSLFDATRAPPNHHTAWAYCHVPNGSTVDMRERIEAQVERFAPGFRDTILARNVTRPADFERHNANYVGGDVVGGSNDLMQLLARPVLARDPYAIPVQGWFLCSASTPPGGGVHGMSGYHAARSALRSIGRDA